MNTVVGSLAAYGLGGLNAGFTHILLNTLLVALQSLVATQFQIACVLLTPTQDMVRAWPRPHQSARPSAGLFSIRAPGARVKCARLAQSGMISGDAAQAFVLATSYVAMSILLSGFYIRVHDMAASVMRGLSWVSYTKYASAPRSQPARAVHQALRWRAAQHGLMDAGSCSVRACAEAHRASVCSDGSLQH